VVCCDDVELVIDAADIRVRGPKASNTGTMGSMLFWRITQAQWTSFSGLPGRVMLHRLVFQPSLARHKQAIFFKSPYIFLDHPSDFTNIRRVSMT